MMLFFKIIYVRIFALFVLTSQQDHLMKKSSLLTTLEKWITLNDDKDFERIFNIVEPFIKKFVYTPKLNKDSLVEIKDWIFAWMIVNKKFLYILKKLKENYAVKEEYSNEEQKKDFKALLYRIVNVGAIEYYNEKKYYSVKNLKKDEIDSENDNLPEINLLKKYDEIYNPAKKFNVKSLATPIGEGLTLGDTLPDKESEEIDLLDKTIAIIELNTVQGFLNKVSVKLRVPYKLSFFPDLLTKEEFKWIQSETGLSTSEVKNKIKVNYDVSTKIRPISSKFIAELLNLKQDAVSQRVSRVKKLLKSTNYIKQLKKDYKIK